jgi:hypothetical protein
VMNNTTDVNWFADETTLPIPIRLLVSRWRKFFRPVCKLSISLSGDGKLSATEKSAV